MSDKGTIGTRLSPASARVGWVDYAKGICIVMVVMMHSTLGVEVAAGKPTSEAKDRRSEPLRAGSKSRIWMIPDHLRERNLRPR